eukprot:Rmarinus@m.26327
MVSFEGILLSLGIFLALAVGQTTEYLDSIKEILHNRISHSPNEASLYRDLATVEFQLGNLESSVHNAQKAVEIDPTDVENYIAWGNILMLSKYNEIAAIDVFYNATLLSGSYPEVFKSLAIAHRRLAPFSVNHIHQAIKYWRKYGENSSTLWSPRDAGYFVADLYAAAIQDRSSRQSLFMESLETGHLFLRNFESTSSEVAYRLGVVEVELGTSPHHLLRDTLPRMRTAVTVLNRLDAWVSLARVLTYVTGHVLEDNAQLGLNLLVETQRSLQQAMSSTMVDKQFSHSQIRVVREFLLRECVPLVLHILHTPEYDSLEPWAAKEYRVPSLFTGQTCKLHTSPLHLPDATSTCLADELAQEVKECTPWLDTIAGFLQQSSVAERATLGWTRGITLQQKLAEALHQLVRLLMTIRNDSCGPFSCSVSLDTLVLARKRVSELAGRVLAEYPAVVAPAHAKTTANLTSSPAEKVHVEHAVAAGGSQGQQAAALLSKSRLFPKTGTCSPPRNYAACHSACGKSQMAIDINSCARSAKEVVVCDELGCPNMCAGGTTVRHNLVMGMAANYGPETLRIFVASLRAAGSDADLVLFVPAGEPVDPSTKQLFDDHCVQTIEFDAVAASHHPFGVRGYRYQLYRDFLVARECMYDTVLLSDTRDAFFQADPFQALARLEDDEGLVWARESMSHDLYTDVQGVGALFNPTTRCGDCEDNCNNCSTCDGAGCVDGSRDEGRRASLPNNTPMLGNDSPMLHLFLEDGVTLGSCAVNNAWMSSCWGREFLAYHSRRAPACSGVTMGSVQGILSYIDTLTEAVSPAARDECQDRDQSFHNFFLYGVCLKNEHCRRRVRAWGHTTGPVASMHHVVASGRASPRISQAHGEVFRNSRGDPFAIVHQFDRDLSQLEYVDAWLFSNW